MAVAAVFPLVLTPPGCSHLGRGKGQQVPWVALLRFVAAASALLKWTGGADGRVEVCLPTGGAPGCHGHGLCLWAGERGWVALFILLDVEIGQGELVRVGLCAMDGGLNERDALLLQGGIADFTAKTAVGVFLSIENGPTLITKPDPLIDVWNWI